MALQSFLEEVMEEEMVLDGTIAQDSAQIAGIWGIREGISVALKHAGTPLWLACHTLPGSCLDARHICMPEITCGNGSVCEA